MNVVDHFIGGKAVTNKSEASALFNPSNAQQIGSVLHASVTEVDAAISAGQDAFPAWSKTGLQYRSDLMLEIRQMLKQATTELVDIIVTEAGKTRADATAEVMKALEILNYASGVASWYPCKLTQNISGGVDTYDARYPIGVVAAVAPFNFPVMIPVIQSALAMVCGNTVVVKPSEKVPSAYRLIAELHQQAGLPDGVLNVVNGGRGVVERFIEHPDVAGLTFVGSTTVAKQLRVQGVANDKRVQAFGSGKNHMIVMPDADLDMAADAAVSAGFGAAGQRCMAISVLVAVGGIGDKLVKKIQERIPKINIGSADKEGVELGPVISKESKDRIHSFIESAEKDGAKLCIDGRRDDNDGWLVGASLVDHVQPGMQVYDEEIFGPVLSIVRTGTFEEAMAIANGHPMGNGAAIFTRDGGVVRQYVDSVQAGSVGVNIPIPVATFSHSFGGWKASAFSETKVTGPEALGFFTQIKAVTTRWPDPASSSVNLGFSTS